MPDGVDNNMADNTSMPRRFTHHAGPDTWDRGYGARHGSGTPKGRGYLGLLQRPDGGNMTEYTMGVPIAGVNQEIPSIVPTLDQNEINYLLTMDGSGKIPNSIVQKAVEHAKKRMAQGLSPFYD